ncbi:MAG: hypothetical protein IPM06_20390 [Rhizobiales bacterium]|nr:hypothetical protein [Hyphomicrobiales bacterium]
MPAIYPPCLVTPASPTRLLPYYHVRRLETGLYAVAHTDVETTTLIGAMNLAAEMEAQRRAAAA